MAIICSLAIVGAVLRSGDPANGGLASESALHDRRVPVRVSSRSAFGWTRWTLARLHRAEPNRIGRLAGGESGTGTVGVMPQIKSTRHQSRPESQTERQLAGQSSERLS